MTYPRMFIKPPESNDSADLGMQHRLQRRQRMTEESPLDEKIKARYFQMLDYIYPEKIKSLNLNNQNIILHCYQAGNLGDVSQTLLCAEMLRKQMPNANIVIAIKRFDKSVADLQKVFPALEGIELTPDGIKTDAETLKGIVARRHFPTCFFSDLEADDKLKYFTNHGYALLGIAKTISGPLIHPENMRHHRVLDEYGFGSRPEHKNDYHYISMGVRNDEEGIMLPKQAEKKLSEIQTPWVNMALQDNASLYHMHMRRWEMQAPTLYMIAALENKNPNPIVLYMPLEKNLINIPKAPFYPRKYNEELFSLLDFEKLAQLNIGRITLYGPNGLTKFKIVRSQSIYTKQIDFPDDNAKEKFVAEYKNSPEHDTLELVNGYKHAVLVKQGKEIIKIVEDDEKHPEKPLGQKEIRIINGAVPKHDMEIIQQHANPLFGCTGDLSFSEALVLNKIPLYDREPHKKDFFRSIIDLSSELKLVHLNQYLLIIENFSNKLSEAYTSISSKRRHEVPTTARRWYQDNFNLDESDCIQRECFAGSGYYEDHDQRKMFIPINLKEAINYYAAAITEFITNYRQNLEQESLQFSHHVKTYHNAEKRLFCLAERGFMLSNFPELIQTEKDLWQRFKNNEINFEQAATELRSTIDLVTQNKPSHGLS